MTTFKKIAITLIAIFALTFIFGSVFASSAVEQISGETFELDSYELASGSRFNYTSSTPVSSMSYGSFRAGAFYVSGDIETDDAYFLGVPACGVNSGTLTFYYDYNNSTLLEGNVDKWVVNSSSDTMVAGYSTGTIGKGVAVVLTSTNGVSWTVAKVKTDFLASSGIKEIYTPTEQELKQGTYYRVLIAYETRHRTKEAGFWWWDKEENEYRQCVEVINFYATYDSDPISFTEIISSESVEDEAEYGFRINKNGSSNVVKVEKPDGTIVTANDRDVFYRAGQYTIVTTTKLNVKRTVSITVSSGLDVSQATSDIFESADNSGYIIDSTTKTQNPTATNGAYTSLYVASTQGTGLKKLQLIDRDAFGIKSTGVYLLFGLNESSLKDGWAISSDTWGQYDTQKINNILTGEVKTGAVILQKSLDGVNWQLCSSGSYKDGVFTTDYQASYGTNGLVCVYVPAGSDVLNGVLLNITYAYEVHNEETGETKNVAESYKLSIYNDEVDSVTFHNQTISGSLDDEFDDKALLELFKASETLIDGSITTTGFEIDKSLNPTVDITVLKNGVDYTIPDDGIIKEPGRYQIDLCTKLGTKRTLTIYVCDFTKEDIYLQYFDNQFLTGKRIFDRGDYPVYEGGLVNYNILATKENLPVMFGYILNKTTGTRIEITQLATKQSAILLEAGEYEAVFKFNQTFKTDTPSGDNYNLTYKFKVIENGTAPGPVVNQQELNNYTSNHNPSNSYPIYYGVTYSSASTGFITLAFPNYKSAYDFAYNYEKSFVEKQEDGSFRYRGSLQVGQKTIYDSNWDLTDAAHHFATQAVQRLCFDMSDPFTYTTLSKEVIESNENLRTLELSHSVVVFASGMASELLSKNSLPVLNNKKYIYVVPGKDDVTESGYNVFKFVKDKNGYDSDSVTIIDANGNKYAIAYGECVEDQLVSYGCPTGIVTIVEKTVYGDEATYQAIFINTNDVTTELEISEYTEDGTKSFKINKSNDGGSSVVKAFSLLSAKDELDPYSLVKVKAGSEEYLYSIDDLGDEFWYNVGDYEITVVNRLGYSYTYTLKIEEAFYHSVDVSGAGDGNANKIIFKDGSDTVDLPSLSKYGYKFVGYKAPNGSVYNGEIASIMLKGFGTVEAVWEAKQFKLTLKTADDKTYEQMDVFFGQSYTLPVLMSTETMDFVGWSVIGSSPVKTLSVQQEGDVIMLACYTPKGSTPDIGDSDSSTDNDNNESNSSTSTDSNANSSNTNTGSSQNHYNSGNNHKQKRKMGFWGILLLVIDIIVIIVHFLSSEGEGTLLVGAIISLVLSVLCAFILVLITAWPIWLILLIVLGVEIVSFVVSGIISDS